MRPGLFFLVLTLTQSPLLVASSPDGALSAADRILAKMQAGLNKQKASVERQTARYQSAAPAAPSAAVREIEPPAQISATSEPGAKVALGASDPSLDLSADVRTSPCSPLDRRQVHSLVQTASAHTDLPSDLLFAVMERESAFQPCAVSSKGAVGLMQLMPATAAEMGVKNPFHPIENLLGGARYLRHLLDSYSGDLRLALAAYNAGPGTVREAGGVPDYPETLRYVDTILGRLGLAD